MSHPILLEPGAGDAMPRPTQPTGPRNFRIIVTVVVVAGAIWSALGLEVSVERFFYFWSSDWFIRDVWTIVSLMWPDWSAEAIQRAVPKVMESVFIAWVGTMIGAFFSFPLAFFAAKNVTPAWVNSGIRQLLNAIRAVPELVVAVFLIPGTGLGAWTGALALGIHSIGTLGKLSSEVIEGIDEGPVEAVASAGGGQIARMRFAVVPQVMPNIVAYWLYRFEINVRASAVLGVVGAGGIGAELVAQLRFRAFDRAGTVLFLTVITVLAIDTISARVRRRIISGHAEPGPIAALKEANTWQRAAAGVAAAAAIAFVIFIIVQLETTVSAI
jgi:phosphonate transport system permease protein